MEEKNNKRNKWLHIRLNGSEFYQIQQQFNQTTSRKLSDFVRKKLLDKPLIGSYRDQSVDAYMEELAQLKTGLGAAGNNFNQAVKKLRTLSKIKEFEHWLVSYELDRRQLFKQIEEAGKHINMMADKWLQ